MNHNDIWQYSLQLITCRSYSEKELSKKLEQNGHGCDEIDRVLYRLKEYNYINDTQLANHLFRKYSQANKYSVKQILYKLKQRGLPDAFISEVVKDFDVIEEWRTASKLLATRFKDPANATKEKIYRYLVSRGFSTSSIRKAIQIFYCCE